MRFVEIKTADQQSVLMLHRTRHLFVRQRTTLINALRAHLAEFGIVAGVGRNGLERLLNVIEDGEDDRVPPPARDCLLALRDQLGMVKHRILDGDRRILAWHRSSEVSRRLDDILGVGPLIATALVASVPDPRAFKSGRDLAAWIGLVPRQNSTGGKVSYSPFVGQIQRQFKLQSGSSGRLFYGFVSCRQACRPEVRA